MPLYGTIVNYSFCKNGLNCANPTVKNRPTKLKSAKTAAGQLCSYCLSRARLMNNTIKTSVKPF